MPANTKTTCILLVIVIQRDLKSIFYKKYDDYDDNVDDDDANGDDVDKDDGDNDDADGHNDDDDDVDDNVHNHNDDDYVHYGDKILLIKIYAN